MVSGESGNCDNGEYMTHPAFISLNANGFWVGKFETGYAGATSKKEAQVNEEDSTKIIVKPNVYSWRNNTVYNFFVSAYNYERSLDSHMMKNTEWGAVAYLSHSRYGIDKEVNVNNNTDNKTGYSAYPSADQSNSPGVSGDGGSYNAPYNTSVGYLASTTGNITGIYDMSGGSHEYMASYRGETLLNSGFTHDTISSYDVKYFDIYDNDSDTSTYNKFILGDATGEMSPFSWFTGSDEIGRNCNGWYGDDSAFVSANYPWYYRGGTTNSGVVAGLFNFNRYTGGIRANIGSRLVLVG